MLECLRRLVDLGFNGDDTIDNNSFEINKIGNFIENEEYYYQEYKVNSNIEVASYKIKNLNNFPEGTYIVNQKDECQEEFEANENFKLMIPKSKIKENINGQIEISSKCKNYPIFYGEAPDGRQNYVLTYDAYGDIKKMFDVNMIMNTGRVEVIKMDKENNLKLQGIEFELLSEDGKYKEVGITDEDGKIYFENLFPGKYILKEKNGLKEYEMCDKDFEIEVKYGLLTQLEVVNKLKTGNLKIIKIDKDDVNIKLDRVIFELYDENMRILEILVTDKNGKVESNFYPSENREYYLKEVKTKDGYILNEEVIKVNLKAGETVEYWIENKREETPKEIPEEPIEEIPKEPEMVIPEEPTQEVPKEPEIVVPEEPPFQSQEELPKLPKTGF